MIVQGLEGPVVLDPELLTYTLDLGPCTMICEDRIESLGGTMRLGTGVRIGEGFKAAGSKDEMANCTEYCILGRMSLRYGSCGKSYHVW